MFATWRQQGVPSPDARTLTSAEVCATPTTSWRSAGVGSTSTREPWPPPVRRWTNGCAGSGGPSVRCAAGSGRARWAGGYPMIAAGVGEVDGKCKLAISARMAYREWVGPIPEDTVVTPKCGKPRCIQARSSVGQGRDPVPSRQPGDVCVRRPYPQGGQAPALSAQSGTDAGYRRSGRGSVLVIRCNPTPRTSPSSGSALATIRSSQMGVHSNNAAAALNSATSSDCIETHRLKWAPFALRGDQLEVGHDAAGGETPRQKRPHLQRRINVNRSTVGPCIHPSRSPTRPRNSRAWRQRMRRV